MVEQNREYQVAPGRYLVSADMGEGYENLNDPEKAAHAIEFNFTHLMREFSLQMEERGITSEFDQTDVDSGIYRELETATLEMQWLFRGYDAVRDDIERSRGGQING